ncbi:unnamed protein product [Timema podura]|uniref:BHLH domain-containing protein n=1 Tax=Timema podura TaxID=61482 RepID=A0ABN7NK42_TIMPD|nr:unnamed protein product [Timema podura]
MNDVVMSQRLAMPLNAILSQHLYQPSQIHELMLHPPLSKDITDSNNNSNNSNSSDSSGGGMSNGEEVLSSKTVPKRGVKYSLRPRSIQKRIEVEQRGKSAGKATKRGGGGSSGRPKQKPPPLSKYRRKTANARERDRMREINTAFESLRRAVPQLVLSDSCSGGGSPSSEKLTKITTLRLAMKYISALSQSLQESNPGPLQMSSSSGSSISVSSSSDLGDLLSDYGDPAPDLDTLLLESDGDSLNFHSDLSENCLTPPDFSEPSLASVDFADHSLTPADFGDTLVGSDYIDHSLTPQNFGDPSCFSEHCLTP